MAQENFPTSKTESRSGGGWRYKLGMAMFILPVLSMVLTPVLIPLLGLSAADTAALVGGILIGGELVWFASIPLLGKEGFKRVKNEMFSKLKLTDKPISKARHNWGIALAGGTLAFQMLVLIWIVGGFFYLGEGHLTDGVGGVTFAEEATAVVYTIIASVVIFFVGVWVLGGRFVDRLHAALVWNEEQ
ncbi:MAG: transporter suffix domain-containing protein [Desulfobacterales bacterium]|jgi:hypothetical protein